MAVLFFQPIYFYHLITSMFRQVFWFQMNYIYFEYPIYSCLFSNSKPIYHKQVNYRLYIYLPTQYSWKTANVIHFRGPFDEWCRRNHICCPRTTIRVVMVGTNHNKVLIKYLLYKVELWRHSYVKRVFTDSFFFSQNIVKFFVRNSHDFVEWTRAILRQSSLSMKHW